MAQCTCTSPDGTQSTTYVFESAPFGSSMNCDIACRFWRWNHAISQAYPYGSPEREAKMGSCKMWLKECGSGPDFISLSEPRTQCVAGDSVGAKLVVDHGHGMGQEVDVQLKVVRASDEVVDVVEQNYGPDIPQYAGVEGPLMTITNPNSPFYGQQVKTCMVNGFDSYVYQVSRYPSSSVDPIASTAWGDVDLSTGDNVGQIAVPLFKFRKHGENITDPSASANYGLNPFYDPNAICSVEDFFDISGYTWETIPELGAPLCEGKVRYIFFEGLGSGTDLYKSTADLEFACRMQMGELFPKKDFDEAYNENFSEQRMWQEYNDLSVECIEEEYPYDLDAYCALYHSASDDGICTGYDVENNPLGTAWWSGTSNSYGGTINAFHPYYLTWLKGYLVNELGLSALADADPMTLGEYHTNTTWNNFQISDEAIAYGANKRKLTACVVSKLYEKYPDQFDWRGAFPPSNTQSGAILLPEEMVGTYDWFDSDDVLYEGQVVLQTFSPTSNEYGYEAVPMPEGLVKLEYYEVPLEGQEEVAQFRGEVAVSDDINEARETLTDDTREPEGIFLPEDAEIEVLGAEQDLIDSIEQGQISDDDLNKLFSDSSAEAVREMFDDVDGEADDTSTSDTTGGTTTQDDETIFDDGEVDGEPATEGEFDGMGDEEEDTFTGEETPEEDVTPEEEVEVEDEPVVIDEEVLTIGGLEVNEENFPLLSTDYGTPVEAQSTIQPVAMEMDVETASTAPSSFKKVVQNPIVQAVAVAGVVGVIAFAFLNRKK